MTSGPNGSCQVLTCPALQHMGGWRDNFLSPSRLFLLNKRPRRTRIGQFVLSARRNSSNSPGQVFCEPFLSACGWTQIQIFCSALRDCGTFTVSSVVLASSVHKYFNLSAIQQTPWASSDWLTVLQGRLQPRTSNIQSLGCWGPTF